MKIVVESLKLDKFEFTIHLFRCSLIGFLALKLLFYRIKPLIKKWGHSNFAFHLSIARNSLASNAKRIFEIL